MKYIPLTNGQNAIVDDEDYDALIGYRWSFANGYARRTIYARGQGRIRKGASEIMHRVIMNAPRGMEVDHINRNRLDNRRCNLRLVTHTQNAWNRGGLGRNQSSQYAGVQKTTNGRWLARIMVNGTHIGLGTFGSEIEAARAYDNAARKYRGEYALLNLGESNGAK